MRAGGKRLYLADPNQGYFFQPTLLDYVRSEMKVMREETFGPILTVSRFIDEQEAIEQANATNHGFVACAFTQDLGRSSRLIERLEFGTVGINETQVVAPQLPFGGMKDSGQGEENDQEGILRELQKK